MSERLPRERENRLKPKLLSLEELLRQYKLVDYESICPLCHPAKAREHTDFELATAIMVHHRRIARMIVGQWLRFYLPAIADQLMKPVVVER